MDYPTFVDLVGVDGRRLAAVSAGRLSDEVPSCPGWSVADLVRHVAEVYEHKIACTELGVAPDPWPPEWPSGRDPIEWLTDAHGRLLDMFARNEPTAPSATWWPPDQTVGFWARRMAHETAVHRVDAELAAGAALPIDDDLAVDGIDEILNLMLAGDWSDEPDGSATGQRVEVASGGTAWTVVLDRDLVTVASIAAPEAVARIGGDPSDVDLWLWGRADDDRIDRAGDEEVVRSLRRRLVLATQ
jgi:uncharacterized protein (TIGR03083 family)